jgi:hypothetical protein
MTTISRTLVACCCLWLVSCASPQVVQSTIETHHRLSPADRGKRVIILPADERKAGSLEFVEYTKSVADGLRRQGFEVVPESEPAELVAFFDYGIDQGRNEVYSYAVPQFGQTGIQSSQTFGTVQSFGYGGGTYSGTTTYTPSYGITGWTPQIGTRQVFTRAAILHVYDLSQGPEPMRVYETTIISQGSSSALGQVVDEMVAALFEDFEASGVRTASITMTP